MSNVHTCAYDASRDPHLAAYYARHSVRKQLKRSVIAERLQRRPQHLHDFGDYMGAAEAAHNTMAAERVNVFQRFVGLGEKHAAPSPLSPLLAQVAAQLNFTPLPSAADHGIRSRSSSACDRPAAPPSAPGSRSSSRQSGPPSRPSSAGPRRPPTRSRYLSDGRLPTPPSAPIVHQHRDPLSHPDKRVKFEDPLTPNETADAVPTPPARGRRNPQPSSFALTDYLATNSFENLFVQSPQTENLPTRDKHSAASERVQISVATSTNPRVEPSNLTSAPKTFVLVRFTIDQFLAAGKIQQWYRGSAVRRRLRKEKTAATRIQRVFRRFKVLCKTAFAVWMLEKDKRGKWHPTSKFAQISQRPTSARVRFSSDDETHSGRHHNHSNRGDYTYRSGDAATLVDFHGMAINALGNVMALFVHEPQHRIQIVEESLAILYEFSDEFHHATETLRRKLLDDEQSLERAKILDAATNSVRQLQARRSLALLYDASRQQLLSSETSQFGSLCGMLRLSFECAAEPAARKSIEDDEHVHWIDAASECHCTTSMHDHFALQRDNLIEAEYLRRYAIWLSAAASTSKFRAVIVEEVVWRDELSFEEASIASALKDKVLVLQEIRQAVNFILDKAVGGSVD